jgi:hypothetical protein
LTEHVEVKEAVTEAVVVEEPKAEESNKVTIRIDLLYNLQCQLCQSLPVIVFSKLVPSSLKRTELYFIKQYLNLSELFPHFTWDTKRLSSFKQ